MATGGYGESEKKMIKSGVDDDYFEATAPDAPPPYTESLMGNYDSIVGVESNQDKDEDPVFEGLLKTRKLRDVFCLGALLVYWFVMAFVLVYGLVNGRLDRLRGRGTDYDACDFFGEKVRGLGTTRHVLADDGKTIVEVMDQPDFPLFSLATVMRSLHSGSQYLVYVCLIAIPLALLMTILLRYFAKFIVWAVVICVTGILAAIAVSLWVAFVEANSNIVMIFAIIASLVAIGAFSILYYLRSRIRLVIRLFKEAGKAIHASPLLILQPLLTSTLKLSMFALGVVLALLIETVVNVDLETKTCVSTPFVKFGRILNLFGIFWMPLLLSGFQHFIVAGVVSTWFFTRDKTNLGRPLLRTYQHLVKYNMGSIALGSFVIALVRMARFTIRLLKRKGCKCLNRPLCGISCYGCLKAIDRLIGFLTNNAYIYMAIYGYGFFPSAKRSLIVIVKNAVNLMVINSVGDFVLFLAKFLVVSVSVFSGYRIMNENIGLTDNEKNILCTISVFLAYCVATAFLGMFETAVDTIFLCFCEDRDKNDGISRPYFMSAKMKKVLGTDAVHDVGTIVAGVRDTVTTNVANLGQAPNAATQFARVRNVMTV